jgi:hypothetical protein
MASEPSSTEPSPAKQATASHAAAEASAAGSAAGSSGSATAAGEPAAGGEADARPGGGTADEPQEAVAADEQIRRLRRFLLFAALPGWLVSTLMHAIVLLLLALLTFAPPPKFQNVLTVAAKKGDEGMEPLQEQLTNPVLLGPPATQPMPGGQADSALEIADVQVGDDMDAVAMELELDLGEQLAPKENLLKDMGDASVGLESRGAEKRGEMLARYGGTEASEAAVAAALRWLAEHQLPDGGWSFDHRRGRCRGRCSDPGFLTRARNGATAIALLPFLGAGETHKKGDYKETIRRGLYFLVANMRVVAERGDLSEEGAYMYSHGLGAIALCEAYAMTHDRELMRPAQYAVNHIVYAQDPVAGGWRYYPKEAGDTSMIGWQLMALKSAHMAYLRVPRETVIGASRFLDSVQTEGGAVYGYKRPGDRAGADGDYATTAVGLLCRMYLGWERDNPALQSGVELLGEQGPSKDNMYFNYYATQVMRHYGGEHWERWNDVMRDYLVNSQARRKHMAGSWYFGGEPMLGDRGALHGGRLYFTSLATMILEVYYRHMPIYGRQAVEEDFPF